MSSVATAVLMVATGTGWAGEHQRRLAFELAVVHADMDLLAAPATPAHHRRGLEARIRSALGTLPLLVRRYAEERGRPDPGLLATARRARDGFAKGERTEVMGGLSALKQAVPLSTRGLRAEDASAPEIAGARRTYRTLCMGCHHFPDLSRETPARNLFEQARTLPENEFVARLLGGVRGTPDVGLRNPFTDGDIAGLAAYFKTADHGDH